MKLIIHLYAKHLLFKGILKNQFSYFNKAFHLMEKHHLNLIDVDLGEQYFFYSDADAPVNRTLDTTPLLLAAKLGRREMLNILLEKGANLNYFDATGMNALEYALIKEHHDCALLLWKRGLDVFEHRLTWDSKKTYYFNCLNLDNGRWKEKLNAFEALSFQNHLNQNLEKRHLKPKKTL